MCDHHVRASLKLISTLLIDSDSGLTQEQTIDLGLMLDGLAKSLGKELPEDPKATAQL
ncbi:hypothetical protein [Pseudoalteromonas luteoviolacea]|uniref:hypothetical protein n=1 Tax=Pseudoalteromonas luteoviolacea TaxID=43657 RepID=UPI00163CF0E1|nr:hypothetical protein [Pseudoalteromonas luteoviolacea]